MRWRIDPSTPVPERLRLYQRIAAEGARCPWAVWTSGAIGSQPPEALARAVQLRAQGLGFRPDPPGPDVVADTQTTAREGGDCEDLSIALVSLALACGLPASVVWLDPMTSHSPQAHVAARVLVRGRWLWAEPTVPALLGEHPWRAAERLGLLRRLGQ